MDTPVMNDMPFNGAQHSSLGSSLGISQLSPSLILSMGDRGLRSEGAPGAGSGLGGGFLFEHLTEGGESVLSRLYVWVRVRVRVRVRMYFSGGRARQQQWRRQRLRAPSRRSRSRPARPGA